MMDSAKGWQILRVLYFSRAVFHIICSDLQTLFKMLFNGFGTGFDLVLVGLHAAIQKSNYANVHCLTIFSRFSQMSKTDTITESLSIASGTTKQPTVMIHNVSFNFVAIKGQL